MSDKAIAKKATVNKRKSLLSDLGISASGTAPVSVTPKTTTSPPSPVGRKTSTPNRPSSPSASRTRAPTSSVSPPAATRKKAVPSSIKVDRTINVNGAVNTPLSPTSKRRSSIVPTTSNTRASQSPLVRRASVNASNSSSGSSIGNKRLSTPAGLESLAEAQTMKEQLIEKEKEIQSLKENESNLKIQTQTFESEIQALQNELKLNAEKNTDDDENERIVKETKDELGKLHKLEMKQLLADEERKLESKLAALQMDLNKENDRKIQHLQAKYDQKQDKLMKDHGLALLVQKEGFTRELNNEKELHEIYKKGQESTVSILKQQIQDMQDAQTNSNLRKVQNELDSAATALVDFKRRSQHTTEALEKRYREEIKILQNGSDDTAQAWLEKTKSTQQELDQLHDKIQSKDQIHAQTIEALKQTHVQEMDQLSETCETKEAQIEEQSSQIEDLLYQVETLQNSLEAATVRLEHTAKSSPTSSSSNLSDINDSTAPHYSIKNIHQECLDRLDIKQKELDDLKSRLAEIKETHETQMNRMAQEKANILQELRKQVNCLEQKLVAVTPPSSPTRPHSRVIVGNGVLDEERLIRIAEQHRKELKTMHEQYQIVVDAKDRELEDYAYRVKALVAVKQKDIEKLQIEAERTRDRYEQDIEAYETKIGGFEKESSKLRDRVAHWVTISSSTNALLQDLKRGCTAHVDENAQLIRLVNQLQSEIRRP